MSKIQRTSSDNRLGRISTVDGFEDPYDHAINLFDATQPTESQSAFPGESEAAGLRQLTKSSTHTSVKDQLARRKYAKWRQDRFDSKGDGEPNNSTPETGKESGSKRGRRVRVAAHSDSIAVDFGHSVGSPEAKAEETNKKHGHHHKSQHKTKEESVIDILYENQRGSFFCGIPLYSHSSLLQFDPAAWVNKDFKPSPVNITNAQVPDPSWQWEWKHWYVDMGGDVDEDGWQYSFAFFGKFSWHGTHPWFHSFCRRRRWLRKRTRIPQPSVGKAIPSSMSAAHQLNNDYFTIHSKRDKSPSFVDGGPKLARPDSYMSYRTDSIADEEPDEIDNVAALMKALRLATIDRTKLDAVKKFVETGGEELAYLKEQIPDIMHFIVFQNSKRQLLEYLKQQAQEAQDHRAEHDAENRPEGEAESRRIDNLLKAVEAAGEQITGLEYWSDRQNMIAINEEPESANELRLNTIFDKTEDSRPSSNSSPASGIRGIADEAGVGRDPGKEQIYRGAKLAPNESVDDKGKGKGKAKETNNDDDPEADSEDLDRLEPRLERDQVLIPDEDEAK